MSTSPHNPGATSPRLTLAQVRERLSGQTGRELWQSLDDLGASEDFVAAVEGEFPNVMTTLDPVDRREFLRVMGASLALAGLTACTRQPLEKIVPYVRPPEEVVPGRPLFFATAMTLGGYAQGVLAESHMGRPTKLEGNPEHPSSLGGTDVFAQAEILSLYDPDRSQSVYNRGRVSTWNDLQLELIPAMARQAATGGAGIRVLTGTVTSPTLAAQIAALLEKYPQAKWCQYEPAHRDELHEGALLAFGQRVDTVCDFTKADVILSLDADFLGRGPGRVRYARDFASRRDVADGPAKMNRLYTVHATPGITAASADHTLRAGPQAIEAVARAVASGVGAPVEAPDVGAHQHWVDAVVKDLKAHRGRSIVIVGDEQPAVVHALAHHINAKLGNHGKTIQLVEPIEAQPVNQTKALAELVAEMAAGQVAILAIVGGNPVYNAPADLDFGTALGSVRLSIRHGSYTDETSALCHWHVPATHFLEAWGDARAHDGTVSIIQPLIYPLYDGKSEYELLAAMNGEATKTGYDIVREYWQQGRDEEGFEKFWRRGVHDGLIADTASAPVAVSPTGAIPEATPQPETLHVLIRPDDAAWDGRYANNGWLQELPRPLTKLVWENAALVSPATARAEGLKTGDVIAVGIGGRALQAPVWVTPGQADGCIALQLGYGRARAGRVGNGLGHSVYEIRTTANAWAGNGYLYRTGRRHELVTTQKHHSIEGRRHLQAGTLAEYEADPHFVQHHDPEHESDPASIYPGFDYEKGPQWGMTVDLSRCIGCNACVLACQSENNIPVVGKDQVSRGREMHWIRVDRFYEGGEENPATYHQPVACVHCENAPCEVVCPVAATVHGRDGLNQMVYNRCVGTRYCSNNCPYKVRRFNFYKYGDQKSESLKLMRNPDVTVRARGVMEKCTYCVQRISAARIEAKKDRRAIRDGEVVTACQQACPTRAITFGDITDAKSAVSRLKKSPLNYGVLEELTTRPRTTYLARIRNPNPELSAPAAHGHG